MKSTRFIGTAADRNSGVYNLSEINEKIQDQTYPTNYEIENSCRFDGTSALTSPAFSSAVTTFTVSLWLKRCRLNTGTYDLEGVFTVVDNSGGTKSSYNFNNAQKLNIYDNTGSDATSTGNIIYRDLSAWYQIVIVSNSGTVSFYKNGVLDFTDDRVSTTFASTDKAVLGGYSTGSDLFAGYIADVNFIDGQALDPTHFAHEHPSTGRWSPKRYRGTYGTNGFHLEFKNTGTHTGVGGIGEDTSGNGNHWAVTGGLTAHDITPDSPSNNFLTWNLLDKARDNTVIYDGNLTSTDTSSGYSTHYGNIIVPSSGLYYVEFTIKTFGSSHAVGIYVGNNRTWPNIYTSSGYPYDTNTFMLMHNGKIYYNGAVHDYHPTFVAGDVVALVIDASTRNFWLRKNGSVTSGDNYTIGSQTGVVGALSAISALPAGDMYIFTMASGSADPNYSNATIIMNAGQDPTFAGNKYPTKTYTDANNRGKFYYAPPAGALALCEKNLVQPQDSVSEYLVDDTNTKALTYTGNVEISKFTPYAQDGYSIYFEGSSYLDMDANNENLSLGAGDFTLEFWVFPRPNDLVAHVFGTTGAAQITINANNTLYWLDSGVAEKAKTTTSKVVDNKWNHVAISRASGVFYIYINGVKDTGYSNAADTTDYTTAPSGGGKIGSNVGGDTGTRMIGYLADFRILVGVGLYTTATIDMPTSPLTTTSTPSNCKYLLSVNQNIIKDISSNATPIAFTGNPSIDTFSPYTPKDSIPDHSLHGGSFSFDGNSYIKSGYTLNFAANFTIQGWFYFTGTTDQCILSNNRGDATGIRLYYDSSLAALEFSVGNSGSWYIVNNLLRSTNGSIQKNLWNYFIITWDGSDYKLSVNNSTPVSVTRTTGSTTTNELYIGRMRDADQMYPTGYISDIRIIRGTALTDYTVPNSKLTQVSNTTLLLQPYHTAPVHGVLETLDAYNTDETGKQLTYHKQANIINYSPLRDAKIGSVTIGGAVGDGVELRNTTDFTFGTGEFTIEMWVRPTNTTSSNGRRTLISHRNANQSGTDTTQWAWFINDNNFEVHDIGAIKVSGGGEFGSSGDSLNKWHHVAWCRDSTSMRFYVNGILKTTIAYASYNPNYSADRQLTIGSDTLVDATLAGFITDARVVKGEALYVNTFTPPAYPLSSTHYTTDGADPKGEPSQTLTAITGTVSLLFQPSITTSNTLVAENPEKYFNTVTYVGDTDLNPRQINIGFPPDLIWIKARDYANPHNLWDSCRGFGSASTGNNLQSDTTGAQNEYGTYGYISSVDKNFTTLAHGTSGGDYVNRDGNKMVAWSWRAGGAPTANDKAMIDGVEQTITGNSKLDAGTITPTRMSVNTKAGFSIIKYIGTGSAATVPHGLSSAPEMVMCKTLNASFATNWVIYFKGATTNNQYLLLNNTGSVGNLSDYWGSAAPTNNVFSVAAAELDNNHSGLNIIAYCWHSVPGYSAFGSYEGNSSADGPFIYTGFKPSWIMIKNADDSNNWMILDNQRSPHNLSHQAIRPDSSGEEITNQESNYGVDLLSNGFKPRTSGGATSNSNNASDDTYVYMAFAEQPFTRNRAR